MPKCNFCNNEFKLGDPTHYKKCEKYKLFVNTVAKPLFKKLHDDGNSPQQIADLYNIGLNDVYRIFNVLKIKRRTVKESCSLSSRQERYKLTMLKKYGVENSFSKGPLRKKWEDRLLEEEGIINVFQRQDVKNKIKNSLIKHYGKNYTKFVNGYPSTLDYHIKKYGEIEGIKKYNKLCYEKGKSTRLEFYVEKYGETIGYNKWKEKQSKWFNAGLSATGNNKFTKAVKDALNALSLNYQTEFKIYYNTENKEKYFSYDILLNDLQLIIECNGDFYHANPLKYHENDIMNFPGKIKPFAKDVWLKDAFKKSIAENNGYNIIYIWESEIIKHNLNYNKDIIKNKIYEASKN